MSRYTLNTKEIELLKCMSNNLYKDGSLLRCDIELDAIKESLNINSQELSDIIEGLINNYILTNLDDNSYAMAESVYEAISAENISRGMDTEDEGKNLNDKPFRLNDDSYNYVEDDSNDYEDIELKFSDLRADELGNSVESSDESEEIIEDLEEIAEIKRKRKKKPKTGMVEESFRLNGDTFTSTNTENAYINQHVDFSDMHGGNIRSIENVNTYANYGNTSFVDSADNSKDAVLRFSAFENKDNLNKVLQDGDTVKVSSVIDDNRGHVTSIDKGIVVEGASVIKDDSLKEGFNSYKINGEDKLFFNLSQGTNMTSNGHVHVSKFREEEIDDTNHKRVLTFDGIKRVENNSFSESNQNDLKDRADASTIKDVTGNVSGKIDYDIGNIRQSSGIDESDNGFLGTTDFLNLRTQDVEKNSDLKTARKEANVEMVKNFHTYDFAKLVSDTGINELKSISYDVTSGIQGSYTDDMMPSIYATAGIFEAIAGKAIFEIDKYNQALEDKAFVALDKLSEVGVDVGIINKISEPELRKLMADKGFSEKEIENLYKKADAVIKEYSYRKDIIKKAKSDPSFLSGNQELKDYLINNGFKGLSARKQIEILNELNLTNKNAEVRNLDLRKLNKRQVEKLLERKSLDNRSRLLLTKTKGLQKKLFIETYAGRHTIGRSFLRAIATIRPSEQDLFGTTIRESFSKTRGVYSKAVIRLTGVKIASDFIRKAYSSGYGFMRIGNGEFAKIKNKPFSILESGHDSIKASIKGAKGKNIVNALALGSILKSAKHTVSDSLYQTQSEKESKEKEERKTELTNKISGAIETRKSFEKVSKRVAEKSAKTMKNSGGFGFKRASAKISNKANKEAATSAAKAAVKTTVKGSVVTTATAEAATATATTTGVFAGMSVSTVALLVIAIVVLIMILIMFIVYMFKGFAMAGYEGSTVIKDEMSTFGVDIAESFSDGLKKIEHTAILVSDEATDNDEYVDIKKYLKKIQELDEKREKDVLTFANSRIGTYSPESMGLESYQMNGRYGQNASILAGHSTEYYGSEDKKNGYMLHYLDAYGNEIANHSSNAKDVLSLCAVIFSNQPDDDGVFPYLIEDQWYLMSPKIKWKESEIYCCDTCKAEYNGYDYNLTTCSGNSYSSKYRGNGEVLTYSCNEYYEVSKIQNLIRSGCKVEGDIRTYNYEGCKEREISRYFYGNGYDTYNLYLDDYISYSDYIWYIDVYGSSYFSDRFYKNERYCPGNHRVSVCYGHKDIDIYITVYDKEYAIAKNLYPSYYSSHTGRYSTYEDYLEDFLNTDKWRDNENVKWVDDLYDQDWYDIYGLDVLGGVGFNIGGTLTDADIESILGNLSGEELSIKQQAIVEFALKYVGKIPYYWGGKASSLDFDANNFGASVEADYKGRSRKGLDCSGFIQWVMANNGIKVPGSTAGYSNYSTSRDHSQLRVGDLGFCNVPGSNTNHVGIYAGVDENGNDLWVHCAGSSGTVVNNYNGFKYYISLGKL